MKTQADTLKFIVKMDSLGFKLRFNNGKIIGIKRGRK